jgi:hypothetical protein
MAAGILATAAGCDRAPEGASWPEGESGHEEEPGAGGSVRVGDPIAQTSLYWVSEQGTVLPDLVPPFIPVCDTRSGCETVVGFVSRQALYPELGPPSRATSQLGFVPGPSDVIDDDGDVIGSFVDGVGFVPLDEEPSGSG